MDKAKQAVELYVSNTNLKDVHKSKLLFIQKPIPTIMYVNFVAGPSAGKSVICAMTYAELKSRHECRNGARVCKTFDLPW
jgi:hypothetical protein